MVYFQKFNNSTSNFFGKKSVVQLFSFTLKLINDKPHNITGFCRNVDSGFSLSWILLCLPPHKYREQQSAVVRSDTSSDSERWVCSHWTLIEYGQTLKTKETNGRLCFILGKSLLWVAVLGLVIFYLYALLAFALFRDVFNPRTQMFCGSLWQCTVTIIRYGLVGDYDEVSKRRFSLIKAHWKRIDSTYFISKASKAFCELLANIRNKVRTLAYIC